jgi:prepilin signal peptidase PulO-like enzyme (type II secretory pathway)
MFRLITFVLGVIVGSFLNAVIWRTKTGKSVFRGRSQCVHCDRRLLWRDLVPILSFFIQQGNCRYCNKKISWQYPAVELGTGLLFLFIWIRWSDQFFGIENHSESLIQLFFYFFITSVLIILFVSDLRYLTLPVGIIIPAAFLSFLVRLFLGWSWYNLLLGAGAGFAFFAIQYFLSKGKWLGDGDMYLGALMGAALGFPRIFYALALAYILGAVAALVLLTIGKVKWGSKLPLGVFLTFATFLFLFFGDQIVRVTALR